MIFVLLAHLWSVLLDLIWLGRRAERDKDIEMLLLRQQLATRAESRRAQRRFRRDPTAYLAKLEEQLLQ